MRLILSRKGFDSSAGGMPSPILPDGRLASLPIPAPGAPTTYGEVRHQGESLSKLLECLKPGRAWSEQACHLDPDLCAQSIPRAPGWRPTFGQIGAAQSHLNKHGVGEGDLFLFFGWFRETTPTSKGLRFKPGAPDLHVIFGWLQIGEKHHDMDALRARCPWTADHPHVNERARVSTWGDWTHNTVYLAAPKLRLADAPSSTPGGGLFPAYSDRLRLTAPAQLKRSVWRLPPWFAPDNTRPGLSYHARPDRWERQADGQMLLRSVGRGQEFVLDRGDDPEATCWLGELFEACAPCHAV